MHANKALRSCTLRVNKALRPRPLRVDKPLGPRTLRVNKAYQTKIILHKTHTMRVSIL